MNKKFLIAISSPSGGGKTTIVKELLKKHSGLKFSVSATTRPKRNGEANGKDYFFMSKKEFMNLIKEEKLVEYEKLFGNYYGTLKSEINKTLKQKRKMIFDVDVKGALNIKKQYPDKSKLIFIEPPNVETLQNRLRERNTESESALKKRFKRISLELKKGKKFDVTIINDKLEQAVKEVEKEIKK